MHHSYQTRIAYPALETLPKPQCQAARSTRIYLHFSIGTKHQVLRCQRAPLHPETLCLGGPGRRAASLLRLTKASYARPSVGNFSHPSLPGDLRHHRQRAKLRNIPAEHLGEARGNGQVLTPDIAGANAHNLHPGCVLAARLVLLLCKVRFCCTFFHLNFLRMPNPPLLPRHYLLKKCLCLKK